VLPAVLLSSNRLRQREAQQPAADGRLGYVKMGGHLGYAAAALIRQQVEDIVVAHGFSVSCHIRNLPVTLILPCKEKSAKHFVLLADGNAGGFRWHEPEKSSFSANSAWLSKLTLPPPCNGGRLAAAWLCGCENCFKLLLYNDLDVSG
jgi:hypothetical protein